MQINLYKDAMIINSVKIVIAALTCRPLSLLPNGGRVHYINSVDPYVVLEVSLYGGV